MRSCITGKVQLVNVHYAQIAAGQFAMSLNGRGEYAPSLYAYRCRRCKKLHLTKDESHNGQVNQLVHTAAPRELQEWAMLRISA